MIRGLGLQSNTCCFHREHAEAAAAARRCSDGCATHCAERVAADVEVEQVGSWGVVGGGRENARNDEDDGRSIGRSSSGGGSSSSSMSAHLAPPSPRPPLPPLP